MPLPLKGRRRRFLWLLAILIVCYVSISYLILPATWARIEHEPGLAGRPMVTATAQGIPGDPINVGLTGTREDVVFAFHVAGWHPADPITLKTSLEIIGSVVLDRPYKDAPVNPVWLGSASFDSGVTLSRDTGQVTHKISPNVAHLPNEGDRSDAEWPEWRRRSLLQGSSADPQS
jgi:LssY C-terminus